MAWTYVADYGGTGNKSAGTAATATVTANVNDTLIAVCACDNSSSSGDFADGDITDTGSNSWTLIAINESNLSSSSAASGAVFFCTVTTALSSSTVSLLPSAGTAGKNFRVYRFTGGSATERGTYVTHNGDGTGTGTDTIEHTAPVAGDLVLGLVAAETAEENNATGDSDTTNGSWSTLRKSGTTGSGSAANVTALSQYKIVTGTGTQSWAPTWTNSDWRNLIIALQPGSSDVAPDAGETTAATAAGQPTASTKSSVDPASAVTTTHAPAVTLAREAATPSGAATAFGATVAVGGLAGSVAPTATAFQADLAGQHAEPVETGAVSGISFDAAVSITTTAGEIAATVSTPDGSVLHGAPAAAVTAAAFDVTAPSRPVADLATAAATAEQPGASTQVLAGTVTASVATDVVGKRQTVLPGPIEAEVEVPPLKVAPFVAVSVTAFGASAVQNVVPPTRQIPIPDEDRRTLVAREDRIVRVVARVSRTGVIEESRSVAVTAERRQTAAVEAERRVKISAESRRLRVEEELRRVPVTLGEDRTRVEL